MNAGHLRERITIERSTVTRDLSGGEVPAWDTLYTAYAKVEFKLIGSQEDEESKQLRGRTACVITVRKENRIVTETDRVLFDSEVYEIDSVTQSGIQREWLVMECFKIQGHAQPG